MNVAVFFLCVFASCSLLAGADSTNDESKLVWTVGTDAKGQLIQQVDWLFQDANMTVTNCPIWAGTILTIMKERDAVALVRCNRADVPKDWRKKIPQGNTVEGWIEKRRLTQVAQDALPSGSKNAQTERAANGSKPIRSETNRTSSAAGSRR